VVLGHHGARPVALASARGPGAGAWPSRSGVLAVRPLPPWRRSGDVGSGRVQGQDPSGAGRPSLMAAGAR